MKESSVHQSSTWFLNSGTIVVLITGGEDDRVPYTP